MRVPLIVANWKMNQTVEEAIKFATRIAYEMPVFNKVETVICPPYTALYSLSVVLSEKGKSKLGGQNCHWETSGAYTGEVSPLFLKEMGCHYVIVGHSERRRLFGETDEMIAKKIKAVCDADMAPILCVGETEEERRMDKTSRVLHHQLSEGLKSLPPDCLMNFVVAYEPVWAIGTGNNATPEQAETVHQDIRAWIAKHKDKEAAEKVRLLYGGSVNPTNIGDFMKKVDIDGALVGGASLKVDTFLQIVNYES